MALLRQQRGRNVKSHPCHAEARLQKGTDCTMASATEHYVITRGSVLVWSTITVIHLYCMLETCNGSVRADCVFLISHGVRPARGGAMH